MPRHALVAQPTVKPTRKVTATGLTAAASTALIFAADHWLGLELSEGQAAVIVGVLASLAGYATRDRAAANVGKRLWRADGGQVDYGAAVFAFVAAILVVVLLKVLGVL